MKWLLLAALAACSSKSSAPAKASAAGSAGSAVTVKPVPLDFADDIQHVEMTRLLGPKGDFEVHWHGAPYSTQITCRVEAYNLAYLDTAHDAAPGDHSASYRADPFVIHPATCELRFFDAKHYLQAAACFQGDQLTRGMCDHDVWAVPKLPDGMSVDVQGASLSLTTAGGVAIKAMITVGKELPDKNTDFSIVCDGVKSKLDPGEGVVPLSKLEAGQTVFASDLAFVMEKPVTTLPKQCQLTITNKTQLGTFCLHEGSTDAGKCDS